MNSPIKQQALQCVVEHACNCSTLKAEAGGLLQVDSSHVSHELVRTTYWEPFQKTKLAPPPIPGNMEIWRQNNNQNNPLSSQVNPIYFYFYQECSRRWSGPLGGIGRDRDTSWERTFPSEGRRKQPEQRDGWEAWSLGRVFCLSLRPGISQTIRAWSLCAADKDGQDQRARWDQGYCSLVRHLLNLHKALGAIPDITKNNPQTENSDLSWSQSDRSQPVVQCHYSE